VSRYAWIVALSLVCGSVLAMLLGGGGGSPSVLVIVGVVIVVGGVWLRSTLLSPERRTSAGYPIAVRREPRRAQYDGVVLGDQQAVLDRRSIAWIEGLDFNAPWRDDQLASLREFGRLERERAGLPDLELELALEELGDAVRAFLDLYDRVTITDPMLRDQSWRIVAADRLGTTGGDADAAEQLRRAAGEIVEAYERQERLLGDRSSERSARARR
jgi:hypothetical protein